MKIILISLLVIVFFSLVGPAYSFFEGSPYQKWQDGVPTFEICREGLKLIFKSSNDSPACVKPETAGKLVERGWGTSFDFYIDEDGTKHYIIEARDVPIIK